MKRNFVSIFFVLIVLLSLASSQALYDQVSTGYKKEQRTAATSYSEPLIPTVGMYKLMSLGQGPLMVDIVWLQTIQYFGAGNPNGTYPSLARLMETVTSLDPKFEYGNEFSLIVLPFLHGSDTAIKIGEQAQKELPGHGLLTFYLASVYQINKHDNKRAAELYLKASKEPGAPSAAAQLAGVALAKIDDTHKDRVTALAYWQTIYETAKDNDGRARAKAWFTFLQGVYDLEDKATAFKQQNGRFPTILQELVDQGYISSIPTNTVNRTLVIDPLTGKIKI